jgi:hypothetical protein
LKRVSSRKGDLTSGFHGLQVLQSHASRCPLAPSGGIDHTLANHVGRSPEKAPLLVLYGKALA